MGRKKEMKEARDEAERNSEHKRDQCVRRRDEKIEFTGCQVGGKNGYKCCVEEVNEKMRVAGLVLMLNKCCRQYSNRMEGMTIPPFERIMEGCSTLMRSVLHSDQHERAGGRRDLVAWLKDRVKMS
ncbi:hypothetical protein Pmani_017899 [Petrolisthes manimaculis]|uniref:Uncharacterized protein n=1 Tax=Petrolisthes manimaculis TaxID=1843537 RepID=A0AAE1PNT5_9EUCA|nr:hypothetical protein Pmani_017899 [Petrolisthes manimaculis]